MRQNVNSQSHWNAKWLEEGKDTWRKYPALFGAVLSFVEPNTSLIDFGCGNGYFLNLVNKSKKGMKLMGLDISTVAISQLKEFYGIDGIVSKLPEVAYPIENESFDYVTMLDLLEHIDEEKEVMNNAFRILKPGGEVMVAVPFAHSEKYKKFIKEESSEHVRWYDKDVLERALLYYGKSPQILVIKDCNFRNGVRCEGKYYLGICRK